MVISRDHFSRYFSRRANAPEADRQFRRQQRALRRAPVQGDDAEGGEAADRGHDRRADGAIHPRLQGVAGPRGMRQISETSRKIRDAAELPQDFRPNHGLRHTFASHLASSGEVDLYTLQRLMTHKSPMMTQRYAHLRDEALKRGANIMSRIVAAAEFSEAKTK